MKIARLYQDGEKEDAWGFRGTSNGKRIDN